DVGEVEHGVDVQRGGTAPRVHQNELIGQPHRARPTGETEPEVEHRHGLPAHDDDALNDGGRAGHGRDRDGADDLDHTIGSDRIANVVQREEEEPHDEIVEYAKVGPGGISRTAKHV